MPQTKIKSTGAERAWHTARDSLLVRLQCPIPQFNSDGSIALGHNGQPMLRRPSREAMELAGAPLLDLADWYFRNTPGGARFAQQHLAGGTRHAAGVMLNRRTLSRHFPQVPAMMGNGVPREPIALSGASGDFPGVLSDSIAKATATRYALARRVWRGWCREGTARDFREQKRIRIKDQGTLPQLPPGVSVEFAQLEEAEEEVFALGKYSSGITITREALLNDDLDLIRGSVEMFANASGRSEDAAAFSILGDNPQMGDGVTLFASGRDNTISGGLTVDNLSSAKAKLRNQTGSDGEPLDLVPRALIVPPALESTGEQVLHDISGVETDDPRMRLVTSPFLSSASEWFVAADPTLQPAAEVCFLASEPEPRVVEEMDFNSDGVRIKIRHQLAAKALDHRSIVRSTGE